MVEKKKDDLFRAHSHSTFTESNLIEGIIVHRFMIYFAHAVDAYSYEGIGDRIEKDSSTLVT